MQLLEVKVVYSQNHWELHYREPGRYGQIPLKDEDGNLIRNELDTALVQKKAEEFLNKKYQCGDVWRTMLIKGETNVRS